MKLRSGERPTTPPHHLLPANLTVLEVLKGTGAPEVIIVTFSYILLHLIFILNFITLEKYELIDFRKMSTDYNDFVISGFQGPPGMDGMPGLDGMPGPRGPKVSSPRTPSHNVSSSKSCLTMIRFQWTVPDDRVLYHNPIVVDTDAF